MPAWQNDIEEIVAELNRAAAPVPKEARLDLPVDPSSLDSVLSQAVRAGASDVLIIADVPVTLRIGGSLTRSGVAPLTAENARNLLLSLLTQTQQQELQRDRSVDFCFSREGIGRFRANIHHQRGSIAGSVRVLPERIPTFESLHLPAGLRRLADARQGLVLVTGPTGCGKSSTLAAIVDHINSHRHDHVVTIEDPVEFVHTNRKSIIEQIEVGRDAKDFSGSLRSILRQDPDVILVGEMRDAETVAAALTAAETGHLVLSTLHTNDASQAVSRILDAFPHGSQTQMRQQLSLALLAIVAQQLIPALHPVSGNDTGERFPVVEIMIASSAVRSLIRRGDDHQLYSAISTGRSDGMTSMEQSLAEMVRSGRISREMAVARCFRPEDLARYLQG